RRRRVSCSYRYMRAAPEDVLLSLFYTWRILVSVRERITGAPHFLFECHNAALQMFERTCADSFRPNRPAFARCELSRCPVSLIGNSRASYPPCLLLPVPKGHPADRNRAAETSSNSFRDAVASAPSAVSTCACAPRQRGTALSKARR